jgi:hypothetical protein
MSNDKPVTSITAPIEVSSADSTETKRPNVLVRTYRKVRNTPPRTAIAVGAGVALVGAGAFLGRKSASYHVEVVEDDLEPSPVFLVNDADSDDSVA